MSVLPPSYYRLFEKQENMGAEISRRIGGVGCDASEDLKKSLDELFKEWRKEWKRLGLLPKRKPRNLQQ